MPFNLFINNLKLGLSSEVAKFAEESRKEEGGSSRKAFPTRGEGAGKWQMELSARERKVMQTRERGRKSLDLTHMHLGVWTGWEQGLQVIAESSWAPSAKSVGKPSSMLGRELKIKLLMS